MNTCNWNKNAAGTITILLLSICFIKAQKPDWNKYADVKARIVAVQQYGADCIRRQQFDEAVAAYTTALQISQKASLDSFSCSSLFNLGVAYRYKSKFESALTELQKAKQIADREKFILLQASVQLESYFIYNRWGKTDSATAVIKRLKKMEPALDTNGREHAKIEMYLGHDDKHKALYSSSLEHYYNALRVFLRLNDSLNIGNVEISLANVLAALMEVDKALRYHQQAADIFTHMGRLYELGSEYINITDLYYTNGKLDSAEIAVRKSLAIGNQLNETTFQTHGYFHLGQIYCRRKKFPEAEKYYLHGLQLSEATGLHKSLFECYRGLGEMYTAWKQPAKAEPYLEKILQMSKVDNNREGMLESFWNLSMNESALHHYYKAFEYGQQYSIYKDSAYTESMLSSTSEMESKYQAEKKESEIALLKKDQQLDRLSLQKQKTFQTGAVIFLVLLLLIGFLLINRYRLAQQTKRMIDMERMRNSLARDLHDDIGSTLTSINILSKVALQQESGGEALMVSNMQKIKDRSAAIMESVSDIVWAINPKNDTTEQMIFRMKEFTAEILEPLNINFNFKEEGDLASLKLNIKKRKDFYLLFKEAINNAAKYSHCTNLIIHLKQEGDSLHLSVKDDGAGFNVKEIKNGNGLRNMRDRAAAMGAKINIDTGIGKGTGIVVDTPIT